MNRNGRRPRGFQPRAEGCEPRFLLSGAPHRSHILALPVGAFHPERPNTPVLPFLATNGQATFIDPSAHIAEPKRITMSYHDFIAPFAVVNARNGAIRIGQSSSILDNATLVANPGHLSGSPLLTIGENTIIAYNARIIGPGQVGGFQASSTPTYVGPGALLENSSVGPGSLVGAGAHLVNVTIPSGVRVLPGVTVSSQDEATNPALGKVVRATASDIASITTMVQNNVALAGGYTSLYQGQSATGASGSPETVNSSTIFNGNLSAVRGLGDEPGSTVVSFEPSKRGPQFPLHPHKTFTGNFFNFPARITGGVTFGVSAHNLQRRIGKALSIRGDEGQPITINSVDRIGNYVTIHAPRGGNLTVGKNLRVGNHAVILGGLGSTLGDNVVVGSNAIVENSKLGSGVVIGDGAYISGTTLAAGTVVPAGALILNGKTLR